jgi:hypothetical protein
LEIYEIDELSKDKYEELCSLKQPIKINNFNINNELTLDSLNSSYSNFELNIIKNDYTNSCNVPLILEFEKSNLLFKNDNSGIYFSEYNQDFLEDTTLEKYLSNNDLYLRPYCISYKSYDLIMGSNNSYSTMKCVLNCRNVLFVNDGSIEVTLCIPNNKKYLYVLEDNEKLELISQINIYDVQEKYKHDFNKIKFLRVILNKNMMLQIPAYWFYSIKIIESNTLITNYKYRTFMNDFSIIPNLFTNFLQKNNIKHNFTKIIS